MNGFRAFLSLIFVGILIYTIITIANHGLDIFPIFFGDIKAMTWPGQFNFDFLGFLLLSGLWVCWRNQFKIFGMALGVLAVFGGMFFLSAYLLYLTFQTQGDIRKIMLGDARA